MMQKKIYLLCPVRNCDEDTSSKLDKYVAKLEDGGKCKVHYPPRDVCQEDDGIGLCICEHHRKAMKGCDEVHFWWDKDSKGSHFDFGMAYMLASDGHLKFVIVNEYEETSHKSYGNALKALASEIMPYLAERY